MPNHVLNELIFSEVDADAQAKILSLACDGGGNVDFNILVPMANNIWQGNGNSSQEVAFKRTWYQWSIDNWGTKWNAYSNQPVQQTDDSLTLTFETACAPPYPWLAALFNTLDLSFTHNFLDEGADIGRQGHFRIDGPFGKDWNEQDADDTLHRHLHKLHWGVEEFPDDEEPPQS